MVKNFNSVDTAHCKKGLIYIFYLKKKKITGQITEGLNSSPPSGL